MQNICDNTEKAAGNGSRNRREIMKQISTPDAPAAIGPYCQAMRAHGFIFTSGQIPLNPKTGEIEGSTIEEQSEQVMKNLQAVLEAAGSDLEHALKTTCYLADIADFAAFNEVYAKYFTGKPARSCFAVKDLPKGAKLEVEVIALCKKGPDHNPEHGCKHGHKGHGHHGHHKPAEE